MFSGKSSKPLQEILLLVDNEIPTEEQLQKFKDNALPYLNDIKTALENTMKTRFQYIFSGSTVERFGLPFMMSYKTTGCMFSARACYSMGPLDTDVDVMFSSLLHKASFSGHGNILIKPLVTEGEGFTGYAQLTHVTPGVKRTCISSQLTRQKAFDCVQRTPIKNLPGVPCCCETPYRAAF